MTDRHAPAETVLTEEQRSYVERWLRAAGDQLGLRGWIIRASASIAHENAYASSHILNRSDEIEVAVGREFTSRTPEEQRETLIHELLHSHFHRLTQLASELVEHELGRRTEAIIDTAISFQEELAIERLAKAIAVFYPPVELPAATTLSPNP